MLKNETENLKNYKQFLTEENQVLTSEVKTLKKDQESLKELTHTLEKKLEKEIERLQFKSDRCDHKSKTQIDLWKHRQTHNCTNQNHHVDVKKEVTFEEFLCFYCEILIKDRVVLEMHRSECFKIPSTDYPCDKCGLQCSSEEQEKLPC